MKCRLRSWWVPLLAVVLTGLGSLSAEADSKYVSSTGTATGDGKRTITIEPVSLAAAAHVSRALTIYTIDVTIFNGSSPTNSAIKIRDSLDVGLPAEFLVTVLPPPNDNTVEIDRTLGGFDMSITGTVPGQTIQEVPRPPHTFGFPMFGGGGLPILLGLLLLTAGVIFLARRRRVSRGAAT